MAYPTLLNITNTTDPLLTVNEAAEFLHVHANTLRRWSDVGLLVAYRVSARGDRRFFKEDLLRFLNEYSPYKGNKE